jgi:hypothetical protein
MKIKSPTPKQCDEVICAGWHSTRDLQELGITPIVVCLEINPICSNCNDGFRCSII